MNKFLNLIYLLMAFSLLVSCNEGTNDTTENGNVENPEKPVKFTPPVSEEVALKKADSVVALMNLDEKLDLIRGHRGFIIKGYEKYNLPEVFMTDASQGLNIRQDWFGEDISEYALEKSTAFPNMLEMAATWNPEITNKFAKSIGEECRAAGAHILLGPGMNIYRHSQYGRNFEYVGEDPYLAGKLIEQYVVGLQNTGVIATIKHFIVNNTDYRRRASNSVVEERVLHEIYAPAFKRGIDAGAMAVMTAYNQVNGEWAGQSDYVINDLLRGQLGYKNLVMTDWWAVNDCKKLVKSGQDIEMPAGDSQKELKKFVENGEVDVKDIDRMCKSIIKTIVQMGFDTRNQKDVSYLDKFPEHEQVALETAREGIVLLRNENNILPIEEGSTKNILITGMYVHENVYGGGSGQVKGYNTVTIIDALKKVYPNITHKKEATDDDIKNADVVMISVGTFDWEGSDRHFAISKEQEELVLKASKLNPNTMVIVNSGGGIRMTDWTDVKGIVYNWYPGQIGNVALAEILTGKTNPSGRLPMTIEKEFNDGPGKGYLPEGAKLMCDVEGYLDINKQEPELNRWVYDTGIEDAPNKLYDINYSEGVLVGYRWYDTKKIDVMFPFGHGLSYTSFTVTEGQLSSSEIAEGETLKVSVKVTNTGEKDGATVVQLYVGEKKPTITRPVKELKAFKKVALKAGESKVVDLYLEKDAFAYWNPETKAWTVNKGEFDVLVGQSSADLSVTLPVTIK